MAITATLVGQTPRGHRHPNARAEYERQRDQEKRQHEQATRLRKERSVMLRAKLLTIRDRRRAEKMTQDALRRA